MSRLMMMTASLMMLAATVPAAAGGLVEAGELEAARANARAGGPVSERDAELLQWYGCTSGTRSWACRSTSHHRTHYSKRYRRYWAKRLRTDFLAGHAQSNSLSIRTERIMNIGWIGGRNRGG
jgi:hypothetical protein